jgi:exosome complex RNA-binding protein Rrp42 (RNase PH superfamily)
VYFLFVLFVWLQGRYAYRLCVNLTCVGNAGNMLDVAVLAAVRELKTGVQ